MTKSRRPVTSLPLTGPRNADFGDSDAEEPSLSLRSTRSPDNKKQPHQQAYQYQSSKQRHLHDFPSSFSNILFDTQLSQLRQTAQDLQKDTTHAPLEVTIDCLAAAAQFKAPLHQQNSNNAPELILQPSCESGHSNYRERQSENRDGCKRGLLLPPPPVSLQDPGCRQHRPASMERPARSKALELQSRSRSLGPDESKSKEVLWPCLPPTPMVLPPKPFDSSLAPRRSHSLPPAKLGACKLPACLPAPPGHQASSQSTPPMFELQARAAMLTARRAEMARELREKLSGMEAACDAIFAEYQKLADEDCKLVIAPEEVANASLVPASASRIQSLPLPENPTLSSQSIRQVGAADNPTLHVPPQHLEFLHQHSYKQRHQQSPCRPALSARPYQPAPREPGDSSSQHVQLQQALLGQLNSVARQQEPESIKKKQHQNQTELQTRQASGMCYFNDMLQQLNMQQTTCTHNISSASPNQFAEQTNTKAALSQATQPCKRSSSKEVSWTQLARSSPHESHRRIGRRARIT